MVKDNIITEEEYKDINSIPLEKVEKIAEYIKKKRGNYEKKSIR